MTKDQIVTLLLDLRARKDLAEITFVKARHAKNAAEGAFNNALADKNATANEYLDAALRYGDQI